MQETLGVAGLLGSVVLVGLTAWYAWQTQQMVREMKAGRSAALRPDVRLDPVIWPNNVMTRIENVGAGPAMDVRVVLSTRSSGARTNEQAQWGTPVLRPGESRTLNFPFGGDLSLKQLHDDEFHLVLDGTCRDLEGARRAIADEIAFEPSTRRDIELVDHPTDEVAADHLKTIAAEVGKIRGAIEHPAARG